MTLRAKPVARRRGRAGWDPGDRRNSLINLGFFLAIGLSILILVGYAAWSWYDGHFGGAATVNGVVITKDDLRTRVQIESFRLDYIESRIQTLQAQGRLSATDAQQQIDQVTQRRNQLASLTLDRLVDVDLMSQLATQEGVTVTDADIDAQLIAEATTAEERHVWMIEIAPVADTTTGKSTDDQKRTALVRAQQALAKLKAGQSWEDVARTSSDAGSAGQAGDLGWMGQNSGYDQAFMAAVFAAQQNQPTQVIVGADGTYRIGRYTEDAPATVDPNFQASITAAKISLADYRVAVRGDVVRQKLSDKVVADLSQPGPQRHLLEIYLPVPNASSTGAELGVKVRQIVFAPNHDTATSNQVPAQDPAWAKAKADADAAYATLQADPSKFDALARSLSDERSAKTTGGKQPWYYQSSTIDLALKTAIFAAGLTAGQILPPVKSAVGWHVIQFLRSSNDTEATFLTNLKAKITDEASFRQAAIDNGEANTAEPNATSDGDIGWIARGQLTGDLERVIFAASVGHMSDVKDIPNDGTYLFWVLAEETRTPTQAQLDIFKNSGFTTWYTTKKGAADIKYLIGSAATTG
ncbi:MAG TPA: peptidylprolyl isomerase [Candidatus Binatus sp.]|nr:peptidylprolyl isomerase [Candidatus Binatus sp.]